MQLLLVDDDFDLRSLLVDLLSLEGFDIDEAENGQQALEKLAKHEYSLILLDIMMPIMDGIETLKQIRPHYQTPVLMLTARGDDEDRVRGLELGADDYLAKPFNDRELVARIKAILRRSEGVLKNEDDEEYLVDFEGILLNKVTQEATYNGVPLALTTTEFGCLDLIISQVNTIVSRDALSIKVLGKKLSPFDRAVDVHMSNLRKKLPERINGQPWFKTLRGRGYMAISSDLQNSKD